MRAGNNTGRATAGIAAPLLLVVLLAGSCVTSDAPPESPWRNAKVETVTYDPLSRAPSRSRSLGSLVWGLDAGGERSWSDASGNPQDGGNQDPGDQDPDGGDVRRAEEARLRSQFGSGVIIQDDGRITQQYPFVGEGADVFLKLISKAGETIENNKPFSGVPVGGDDASSILGRMLQKRQVEVSYIPSFTTISGVAIRDSPKQPAVTGAVPKPEGESVTHLVLVTGLPSHVLAFERALDLFYANMPQVEISVQVIEFSSADALTFGVNGVDAATPTLNNLNSGQLVRDITSQFPIKRPLVGSNPVTDAGIFTLGGIHDSWELLVQLQALESKNLANILSSPRLVVRNGGAATISTSTDFPFPKARINTATANTTTDIEFRPVGVSMNILPTIAGTQTVVLQISASVSAVTGFAQTDPVDTPIISDRSTTTTVHVNHNQSVVIGGLVSESEFESETKVPILGDIPILGFLFRSTSTSTTKTELQFIITPKIVRGSSDIRAF